LISFLSITQQSDIHGKQYFVQPGVDLILYRA